MKKRIISAAISAASLLVSAQAIAAIEPAPIQAGAVDVIPMLSVQAGYDDNFFSTSGNEQDETITVITPSVQLIAEDGVNAYRVIYQLSRGIHQESSADNYTDHNLSAEAHLEFSQRSALDLSATLIKGHETRGTGLSATGGVASSINAPLEYDTTTLAMNYIYGAPSAQGRIQVYAEHLNREFNNFRAITEGRDATEVTLGAVFYYQVAPKTSLLFEARNKDVDYDVDPASSLDSNTWKYFVGATWEGTARTTGTVKVGLTDKSFASASRDDFTAASWEASVRWAPKTYSVVDISTGRSGNESSGNGDFIDSKTFNVNWNHGWNDLVSTDAGFGLTKETYEGAADGRKDDITSFNLGLNYDMRRWLSMGLSYQYSDTDSNLANTDYSKNLYMLTVNASL